MISLKGANWVPIVLVGNKNDLRREQRQVSEEQGRLLANTYKCAWIEASARFNENISKAFELLIMEIEKSQNPESSGESKCTLM